MNIGDYCLATFPYYDIKEQRMRFKQRPMIILGEADNTDFIVLPVSTVSKKEYLDLIYDFPVSFELYPDMNIKRECFIRTHKQAVINQASIVKSIVNIKERYPELWLEILVKVEDFQKQLITIGLEK